MTGLDGHRVYLDWNASAPLRPQAREAMLAAMDVVGNPSSVHAEGRAARAIVEGARGQVARLVGCEPAEVVFTSGATEANAIALFSCAKGIAFVGSTEHDSVYKPVDHYHCAADRAAPIEEPWNAWLPVRRDGRLDVPAARAAIDRAMRQCQAAFPGDAPGGFISLGAACGETGVVHPVAEVQGAKADHPGLTAHSDATQTLGKIDLGGALAGTDQICVSGHKIGSAKGVGAIAIRAVRSAPHGQGLVNEPLLMGGGQESGRRSGTENVVGIAGFGAAAEAARRELEAGAWERVSHLRDALEDRLESAAPDLILIGKGAPRLPNTSCFAVPGWAGETQVMQMDLAGFAVSAGSACSSGKVKKASRVLLAMGFDEDTSSSAVRVSMGPTTTEAEVMAFADAWIDRYRRRNSRAA